MCSIILDCHGRNRNAGTGTARWSLDGHHGLCDEAQRHESDVSDIPRTCPVSKAINASRDETYRASASREKVPFPQKDLNSEGEQQGWLYPATQIERAVAITSLDSQPSH